ncbi:MAG: cation-translocating P-type ATPase [Bacillota bacterium]
MASVARAWSQTVADIVAGLGVDLGAGLSESAARQRLRQDGPNRLPDQPAPSLLAQVLEQARQPLVLLLLAAAAVSFAAGEGIDAAVIAAIVVLNTAIGVTQQRRAEGALAALQALAGPVSVALRDGQWQAVPAETLVRGDVIRLEAGDRVPADCRLVSVVGFRVDEAPLTGESEPVDKLTDVLPDNELPLADRDNLAFMGTTAVAGRARGIVIATGMDTEVGRIAGLLRETTKAPTPLERQLGQLGRSLGLLALILVAGVFAAGLLRGLSLVPMFLLSVSLAVAVVPEGLPTIVIMVLALGVQRMAKRNAIIRRLPAVETLGAASVVCSDKTGTLTQNAMAVRTASAAGAVHTVQGDGYEPLGEVLTPPDQAGVYRRVLAVLAAGGVLASDAELRREGGQTLAIGDPTEAALLAFASRAGADIGELRRRWERVHEVPFTSERKLMSTICTMGGSVRSFTKGAPDLVMDRCTAWLGPTGERESFSASARAVMAANQRDFAGQGLRVLAVAYRDWQNEDWRREDIEQGLTLAGLIAMADPPRPEVPSAVAEAQRAGIRVVMITGDHRDTALAIADQVGILRGDGQTVSERVLSGPELEGLSREELIARAGELAIYARVSPEHKLRIVDALQSQGDIVAMTGDGVNDAPALKRSDIGVAMGITGTDVAKGAADMVLADDNFATIVAAVREGRTIFANIRKAVFYLLSCNAGELAAVLGAILAGLGSPLSALQILWLNLVTDGPPALGLGLEPPEPNVMLQPPRPIGARVLDARTTVAVVWQGLAIGGIALALFAWALAAGRDEVTARTMAFLSVSLTQLIQAMNARSLDQSLFVLGLGRNRTLLVAIALSALLTLAIVALPPLRAVFGTVPLSSPDWVRVVAASLLIFPLVEAVKAARRRRPA